MYGPKPEQLTKTWDPPPRRNVWQQPRVSKKMSISAWNRGELDVPRNLRFQYFCWNELDKAFFPFGLWNSTSQNPRLMYIYTV